jgi:hypothetical protein
MIATSRAILQTVVAKDASLSEAERIADQRLTAGQTEVPTVIIGGSDELVVRGLRGYEGWEEGEDAQVQKYNRSFDLKMPYHQDLQAQGHFRFETCDGSDVWRSVGEGYAPELLRAFVDA